MNIDSTSQPPSAQEKVRHRLRSVAVFVAGIGAVTALLYVCRVPIFIALARVWIVDQPPVKADAIMVLGGGIDTRPQAAARFYQQGLAPVILVPLNDLSPTEELGLVETTPQLTQRVLEKLGVPASAIQIIGTNVMNTHDEAEALKAWVVEHSARNVLIPTDLFHSHRVHWYFTKILKPVGCVPIVQAITPRRYAITNWWLNELGLIEFETEVLKTAFYSFRY